MLLIGDLHITSKYKDKLISELQSFVDQNSDEKNIIFLWDYVYHFSYDRGALLSLFSFFVSLFESGKQVYVLAGNHDRLWETFVFEEAQKAFSLFEKYQTSNKWLLKFITEPSLEIIENQQILFFPYTIKSTIPQISYTPTWLESISYLATSQNKNEQKSREINTILADYIEQNPNLLVLHHYYFNGTMFPGQKSRFSYKDVALSNALLESSTAKFISGHLHQAFSSHNYLCVWSARSTSSLEVNQQKYIFKYSPAQNTLEATSISINPYIQIDGDHQYSDQDLQNQISNLILSNQQNFTSSSWKPTFHEDKMLPLSQISLSLSVDVLEYDQVDQYLTPELQETLKEFKLKKRFHQSSWELIDQLKISSDMSTFSDRKQVLKDYLAQKFGPEYAQYEAILQDLKVL